MPPPQRPEPNYEYLQRIIHAHAHVQNPAILDFGCGKGPYALYLAKRGLNISAAEIDETSLAAAKIAFAENNLPSHTLRLIPGRTDMCVTSEGYRLPFDDHSFDFIYSMVVFEHIFNLEETLAELNRVLKPNGVIFTCFPPGAVLIEPHHILPFVHWLPYSSIRKWYIEIYNRLGAGTFRGAQAQNKILKNYTFYRSNLKMDNALRKHFRITEIGITAFRTIYTAGSPPPKPTLLTRIHDILYKTFVFRNVILKKK